MLQVRFLNEGEGNIIPTRDGDDVAALSPGKIRVDISRGARAAGAMAAAKLQRQAEILLDARGLAADEALAMMVGIIQRSWRYHRLRTKPGEDARHCNALGVISNDATLAPRWAAMAPGMAGGDFARDLVAEPSNTLTPLGFVERLAPLRAAGVAIEVLHGAALQGFGGVNAVGQGSVHPPCVAVLRWAGNGGAPVAFVGKGITFDTGGICIKPADKMWEMRADMAGAAACAGAMLALAQRRSMAAAIAVLPLAENAMSGAAYRPGDVLHMLNGTTVQVVDTDAEGRLVLADALVWAAGQKPRAMIDLATLTGSIVVALGHEMAGMFSNNDHLAQQVQAAGTAVNEPVWRMPMGERYRRDLDSDIADIKHCVDGSGQPDACQAASFLAEFAGDVPWVHLDIAGTEQHEEENDQHAAGPTGFGARLLDRLVADYFEAA